MLITTRTGAFATLLALLATEIVTIGGWGIATISPIPAHALYIPPLVSGVAAAISGGVALAAVLQNYGNTRQNVLVAEEASVGAVALVQLGTFLFSLFYVHMPFTFGAPPKDLPMATVLIVVVWTLVLSIGAARMSYASTDLHGSSYRPGFGAAVFFLPIPWLIVPLYHEMWMVVGAVVGVQVVAFVWHGFNFEKVEARAPVQRATAESR